MAPRSLSAGALHARIGQAMDALRPTIIEKHADADFVLGAMYVARPGNGYILPRMELSLEEIEAKCKSWPKSLWLAVARVLISAAVALKKGDLYSSTIELEIAERDLGIGEAA